MNRRQMTALLALGLAHEAAHAALPEVTAPTTPEGRLREAVARWHRAEAALADTLRAYKASREQIYSAMVDGAGGKVLARLVQARQHARSEWRTAQREAAEAQQWMEAAAQAAREET